MNGAPKEETLAWVFLKSIFCAKGSGVKDSNMLPYLENTRAFLSAKFVSLFTKTADAFRYFHTH